MTIRERMVNRGVEGAIEYLDGLIKQLEIAVLELSKPPVEPAPQPVEEVHDNG